MKDKTVKTLLFIGLVSLFGLYFLIFLKISELDRENENESIQTTVLLKHHKRQKNKEKKDADHKNKVSSQRVADQNDDKIVEPEEQNVTSVENSNSTNSTDEQEADYNFEGHSIMSKHTSFKQNNDGSEKETSVTKFLEGKFKGELGLKGNYPVDKMTFLTNYVKFSIISADSSFKRTVNWQSVVNSARKVANIKNKEKVNWTLIDILVKENFAEQNFEDINLLRLYSIEDKYQQYKRSVIKSRSSTSCNQACLDKCKVLHGNSDEFYSCSIKQCDCGGYKTGKLT